MKGQQMLSCERIDVSLLKKHIGSRVNEASLN